MATTKGRSHAEQRQHAYRRGRALKPASDWIRNDPGHMAAYDQGRAAAVDELDTTPAAPHLPAPGRRPRDTPARGGGANKRPGYFARATSPSAALARTPITRVTSAGDGGGLFLAFVLYPIVLSVIKYGAKGPGLWFRAKWLNETTAAPNNLDAAGAGSTGGITVTTPRPPGWKGQWPPPGQKAPLPPGTSSD